ncbi:hypothetical protein [Yokenella regensburgei]|uniref:hypothetical protein n=1 Tax=Yokenella regensburgei TaxID=158877 RepID=UPI003ED8BA4D
MKKSVVLSTIPLIIYGLYLTVMQIRFGRNFFIIGFSLTFLATFVYALFSISIFRKTTTLNLKIVLGFSALLALTLGVLAGIVGDDYESALFSGVAVQTIISFIVVATSFAKGNKGQIVVDSETGSAYRVVNGLAQRLSESDARRYVDGSERTYDFSSGSIPIADGFSSISGAGSSGIDSGITINPSSGLPMNGGMLGFDDGFSSMSGTGSSGIDSSITINPSSGLPMNGGMSGLDVGGNSWGTNFNDPSGSQNSYDPNRGY